VAVTVGLIAGYALSRILMQLFDELRSGILSKVLFHAMCEVGVLAFAHVLALSHRFHLARNTGGVARTIERGIWAIGALLSYAVFFTVPALLQLAIFTVELVWKLDVWIALAALAGVAAYVAFTIKGMGWHADFLRAMNDSDTEVNTKVVDSLLNYETIKYFNAEAHEKKCFYLSLERFAHASVKTGTSLATLNAGQAAIMAIGGGVVMVLAALGIRCGAFTVGAFVTADAILMQLYQPLSRIGALYREAVKSLIDMEAMFELLDRPPDVVDKPGARDLIVSDGEIRFDNVVFAYEPGRTILNGVSFRVPPGKAVAVVGASGAGKSTISRVLCRFYDVASGSVSIDGQNIRDVTQSSLRAAIGVVPQDTVLFNDTIAYNIAYGRIGADADEIANAAHLAQLDPLIPELPLGYETSVGERGLKLSGGEKQRVAIARAVLKKAPILLLDEATSALDSQTEREIQNALAAASRNRTTLVIAHRLSTVVDADEILVLDRGVIAERGRHRELLARGGRYAAMWNKQEKAAAARERLKAAESDPDIRPGLQPEAAAN
jgi:ATP-binding cassette subfamily B protein